MHVIHGKEMTSACVVIPLPLAFTMMKNLYVWVFLAELNIWEPGNESKFQFSRKLSKEIASNLRESAAM